MKVVGARGAVTGAVAAHQGRRDGLAGVEAGLGQGEGARKPLEQALLIGLGAPLQEQLHVVGQAAELGRESGQVRALSRKRQREKALPVSQ